MSSAIRPSPVPWVSRILVATDFSTSSHIGARYAAMLAARHNANVFVIHVIDAPHDSVRMIDTEAERRRALCDFILRTDLEPVVKDVRVTTGPVVQQICSAIRRQRIDLLVLGTHGRQRLARFLLGSVAAALIRTVPCNVLTVGPHLQTAPAATFDNIVCAAEVNETGRFTIARATSIADAEGAQITFVHAIEDTATALFGHTEELVWRCRTKLASFVPHDRAGRASVAVKLGPVAHTVVDTAHANGASLIIIGAHHAVFEGDRPPAPWGTAYRVLCGAPCPVLVLPSA